LIQSILGMIFLALVHQIISIETFNFFCTLYLR
jgi:hypothetical protein